MKTMYTTKPDEGCREVEKGIYSRPVRTDQQGAFLKKGWSYSIDPQRGEDNVRQEKEGRQEAEEVSTWQSMTVYEQAEAMGIAKHDDDGKKVHHKTLKKLIEEAQAND